MRRLKAWCLAVFLAAGAAVITGCAGNGEFPNRNLKVIVPFDAGGGVDICCRTIADAAGKEYFSGHSLIVENVPGGGGIIGQTRAANAKADGYTLLASSSSIITNPVFNETIFTPESYRPIGMFCFDPQMMIVAADSEYKTLEELVEAAKKETIRMATPGHTTAPHIAALEMEQKLGVKFQYLHNDSANEQFQQLLGKHVDCALVSAGEGAALIEDGTIRGLGIMNDSPMDIVPDVPTFREYGYDLVNGAFRGISAPADIPDETAEFLEKEFEKILTSEKLVNAMRQANMPVVYKDAEEFQKIIDDYEKTVHMMKEQLNQEQK